MKKKSENHLPLVKTLAFALELLAVRFPLEGYAVNGKCKCNQFVDIGDCRHLIAVDVLKDAKKVLK